MSSYIRLDISSVFRSIFCLALVVNFSAPFLHFHAEEDHLHISGPGHEEECALCELGLGGSKDLAAPTSILESAVSSVSTTFEKRDSQFVQTVVHPFSPRAPPLG